MIYAHEVPPQGVPLTEAQRISAAIPTLRTDRMVLRAPRVSDFPAYADIMTGETLDHIMDANATREDIWLDFTQWTALWLLRGHGMWTCEAQNGDVAGFVGIGFEPGDHEPELGGLFCAPYRGKGFAYEAGQAVRAWAYGHLGLKTLVSCVDPRNLKSLTLVSRLGAVRDPRAEAAHGGDDTYIFRHPAPKDLLQ